MKFSRKPDNISFYCPMCHNKTLYCIDHDCSRPFDVDWHDNFACDECGAEVLSEPQYDGKIRFIQKLESAIGKPNENPKSIESSIDPSEDDSWHEIPDYESNIAVYLDAVIFVDDDGNWEYEDIDYPWAKSDKNDGDWFDDRYNVFLDDEIGVVEKTDDLLFKYIPAKVGTYHISGHVNLVYRISGVEEDITDQWFDENHGYDYDSEIYTDLATSNYIEEKSEIKNFRMQPIDE